MAQKARASHNTASEFDELPMRTALGSYRVPSDDDLQFAKQIGVNDYLLTTWRYDEFESAMTPGEVWSVDDLLEKRERLESFGLRFYGVETMPISVYDIMVGKEDTENQIDIIKQTIQNMGEAGIPVLGYSGHPPNGVGRTTREKPVRGGAEATAFNYEEAKDQPLIADREYEEEELWETYEHFLEEVIPVAEEAGVTLGVHPSDPPVEKLGGLPLLFRNRENFKRALNHVPSENHGLKLCLGCWSEMGEDLPDVIRDFGGENIVYVHFRDVVGDTHDFYETFIDDDESNYDEYEVLAALNEVGFSGAMTPDHVPLVKGEESWQFGGMRGRAHAVGYINGMLKVLRSEATTPQ